MVTDTWRSRQRSPGLQGLSDSPKHLQGVLEPWGAKEFGCLTRTIRQLQKKLDTLRRLSVGRGPTDEERNIAQKLREALHQEEIWARQ
uniref:Uncharacterized protein n=1 Tax=Aegilops tauschii subsp. strangulata TaxID=200361 RepID=A0A453GMJ4_AEGTS